MSRLSLPPPKHRFIDPKTGTVNEFWYRFLEDISRIALPNDGSEQFTGTLPVVGSVIISDTAPVESIVVDNNESFQLNGTTANAATASISRWQNNAGGDATLALGKSRGATVGTHAIVQSGDVLASVIAKGDDGNSFQSAAIILFIVDGTPGVGDMPGRIELATSPDGTAIPETVWTVNSTGAVTGSGSVTARNATAIPAGGTAGAGLMMSSTANFGVFFGSGAPTLSAAKGSLYLRSDGTTTNNRAYINTNGSTTWTALITAA